ATNRPCAGGFGSTPRRRALNEAHRSPTATVRVLPRAEPGEGRGGDQGFPGAVTPGGRETGAGELRSEGWGGGLSGAAEVLRGDRVEELAELLHFVLLLVGDGDAGLFEDVLAGEDGGAGAQGQGDGVGRAGAHLDAIGE